MTSCMFVGSDSAGESGVTSKVIEESASGSVEMSSPLRNRITAAAAIASVLSPAGTVEVKRQSTVAAVGSVQPSFFSAAPS